VRNGNLRKRTADDEDDESERSTRPWWWRLLLRRPADTLAAMVATTAAGAIVVNASWLQHGPHPAPIFAVKPLPVASADARDVVGVLPRSRPSAPEPPRHDVAEKAVERPRAPAAAAPPHKDAIADLLSGHPQAAAPTHPQAAPPTPPAPIPAAPPTRSLGGPSRQVLAVQRALSEYGYGQLKPTGVYDADTKLAIQRFERDHKLPITGEISERVTRELANLTGREIN
jgi:putative peptidoglycan binding protein